MKEKNELIIKINKEFPELSYILNTYKEIELVYQESLQAMGLINKKIPEIKNSSEVRLSFHRSPSTSNQR
jgi:hypothetical protein